ncbi:MAG: hypothetical protein E7467_01920 [Ruminococcaceae bacterium]|nr:hypothetical protein [Oscillospiraceae bacterium]
MTIRFASVNDIKEFVSIATVQPFSIRVDDGEHCVNATSFMEMCTLDFRKPLAVDAGSAENEAQLALAAQNYIAS